jgi:hypothetical protein
MSISLLSTCRADEFEIGENGAGLVVVGDQKNKSVVFVQALFADAAVVLRHRIAQFKMKAVAGHRGLQAFGLRWGLLLFVLLLAIPAAESEAKAEPGQKSENCSNEDVVSGNHAPQYLSEKEKAYGGCPCAKVGTGKDIKKPIDWWELAHDVVMDCLCWGLGIWFGRSLATRKQYSKK